MKEFKELKKVFDKALEKGKELLSRYEGYFEKTYKWIKGNPYGSTGVLLGSLVLWFVFAVLGIKWVIISILGYFIIDFVDKRWNGI